MLQRSHNPIHFLILIFLIFSMLAPWGFDQLNVPAEYACEPPSVRLQGDFCGYPMSGLTVFSELIRVMLALFVSLVGENRSALLSGLLALSFLIITLLPFVSTTLLVWKTTSPTTRLFNVIVWTLAFCSLLIIFILQIMHSQTVKTIYLVRGIGLYLLLALVMLFTEIPSVLRSKQKKLFEI